MGFAVASLTLGILAVCLSFLVVGILFGIAGLVFGIAHVQGKRGPRAMAWWGVGFSALGIIAALGFGVLFYQGFKTYKTAMSKALQGNTDFADWEGAPAPDISVTTLDGETIRLKELQGKRVVLDFWATWCPPCVKEIPHFIQLRKDVSKEDLVIVGISSEDKNTLTAFIKKQGINYPIVTTNGLPAPFDKIEAIPTTFFIDRKGVIQNVVVGYHDLAKLKELALAADFEGAPKQEPAAPMNGPTNNTAMLPPAKVLTKNSSGIAEREN